MEEKAFLLLMISVRIKYLCVFSMDGIGYVCLSWVMVILVGAFGGPYIFFIT